MWILTLICMASMYKYRFVKNKFHKINLTLPSTVTLETINKTRSHEAVSDFQGPGVTRCERVISMTGSMSIKGRHLVVDDARNAEKPKGRPEEKADGKKWEWDKMKLQQEEPSGGFTIKTIDQLLKNLSFCLLSKGKNVTFLRKYTG